MADESYSFSTARTRLEAIVVQVRKKDTSLEKSLDLLEEGVRLANACTELIDHADWVSAQGVVDQEAAADEAAVVSEPVAEIAAEAPFVDAGADGVYMDESGVAEAADDVDDPADEAWADDGASAVDLGADDDPSADER